MPQPLSPLPFVEALNYAISRKVVLPDAYYGAQPAAQRAQSFSVAGLAQIEQIRAVKKSLDDHLTKGGSFADWVDQVRAGDVALDLSPARLDNIFRTNIQAAYNNGRYTQQTDPVNLKLRPYWMYDAVNDSRTRPTHHAMDNTILRYDDPWWATHYPPNGYRCRCTVISLSPKQAQVRGISPGGPNEPVDPGFDYSPADYASPVVKAISDRLTGAELETSNASAMISAASQKLEAAGALAKAQLTPGATENAGLSAWTAGVDARFRRRIEALPASDPLTQLSEAALRVLWAYTTDDFERINDVLRNPLRFKNDPVLVDLVRVIRGVFMSIPDTGGPVRNLVRGVESSLVPQGFLEAHEVGAVIEYNGVTSTSKSSTFANDHDVKFVLNTSRGVDVSRLSDFPSEQEVLFQPGTKFRVTSVVKKSWQRVITLEPVDASTPSDASFSMEPPADGEVRNLTPTIPEGIRRMTLEVSSPSEPNAAATWAAILGEVPPA